MARFGLLHINMAWTVGDELKWGTLGPSYPENMVPRIMSLAATYPVFGYISESAIEMTCHTLYCTFPDMKHECRD